MDKIQAAKRRKQLKEKAVQYLGGKCCCCWYDRCSTALDIHHLDPLAKEFSISSKMTSWKRIEQELKKCILLCANCHRETHDGLHPQYLVFEDRGAEIEEEID